MFQYPRRIEPLVQPLVAGRNLRSHRGFSILVGSSLWCNADVTEARAAAHEVFQYPRRIEPLVQLNITIRCDHALAGFSILVGSSLWCNIRVHL